MGEDYRRCGELGTAPKNLSAYGERYGNKDNAVNWEDPPLHKRIVKRMPISLKGEVVILQERSNSAHDNMLRENADNHTDTYTEAIISYQHLTTQPFHESSSVILPRTLTIQRLPKSSIKPTEKMWAKGQMIFKFGCNE